MFKHEVLHFSRVYVRGHEIIIEPADHINSILRHPAQTLRDKAEETRTQEPLHITPVH